MIISCYWYCFSLALWDTLIINIITIIAIIIIIIIIINIANSE